MVPRLPAIVGALSVLAIGAVLVPYLRGAPGSASARGELPSSGDEAMAAVLADECRKAKAPAMSAAVVAGGGLEASAVAGFRKWGGTVPAGSADLWHLGSDTKVMTSVLVATYVEEGKLSWDSKVAQVLPELAPSFRAEYAGLDLALLLSHRSGLPHDIDYRALAKLGSLREQRLGVVKAGLSRKPEYAPGSRYSYSNLGYIIAGAMCERVGGAEWEQLMRDRVFAPLGMSSAGFGGLGSPGEEGQPWGHASLGRAPRAHGADVDNPPVLGPAGRVHCSISDWSRFVADQLKGARGEPALLKPESYRAIQSPHFILGEGESVDYGFGWGVARRDWAGGEALTHSGCNGYYYAVAWLAPERDFAVLVCANAGAGAASAVDAAANRLIVRALGSKR